MLQKQHILNWVEQVFSSTSSQSLYLFKPNPSLWPFIMKELQLSLGESRRGFRCHKVSATYIRCIPAIWNDPCASSSFKNEYLCLCGCSFWKAFYECLSECCSFFRNGLYSRTLQFFIMLFLILRKIGKQSMWDSLCCWL